MRLIAVKTQADAPIVFTIQDLTPARRPWLLFALLVICFSIFTQSVQVTGAQELELDRLGSLPCRFNGRLTTLSEVARGTARQWGGTESFRDLDGNQHSAVEWYARTLAGDALANEIRGFVASSHVIDLLGLQPTEGHRYAVDELLERPEVLNDEITRIRSLESQRRLTRDRQFIVLAENLQSFLLLTRRHRSPWTMKSPEITEELSRIDEHDQSSVPRWIIPKRSPTGRWQAFLPAAMMTFAQEVTGEESDLDSPYAREFASLLSSINEADRERLDRSLETLRTMRLDIEIESIALRFDPPIGWREMGQESPFSLFEYVDAMAMGIPMSQMTYRDERGIATISLNHFPHQTIDPLTLTNSWRMNQGLAPLTLAEFQASAVSGIANGLEFVQVDLTTPESIPRSVERVIGRVMHDASGTWTTSIYGPQDLVDQRQEAYFEYTKSLRIPAKVSDWVSIDRDQVPAVPTNSATRLAFLKRGSTIDYVVRVTGRPSDVMENQAAIESFVESISQTEQASSFERLEDMTRWEVPEKWSIDSSAQSHQTIIFRWMDAENVVTIEATALEKMHHQQQATMIDHLGISARLSKDARQTVLRTTDLDPSLETVEIDFGDLGDTTSGR